MSQERIVQIERDILSKNRSYAEDNRGYFARKGVLALNFVSSPGSGKTSLLVRAIEDLKDRHNVAVIEGDQQTSNDAERIRATGARALQVNTGKGCHLDAHMVGHALETLDILAAALEAIRFRPQHIRLDPAIHAAEQANQLVVCEGIPFREAYRRVAAKLKKPV